MVWPCSDPLRRWYCECAGRWATRAAGILSRRIQELRGAIDGLDPSWKLSDRKIDSRDGWGKNFRRRIYCDIKAVHSGFKVLDVCVLWFNSSGGLIVFQGCHWWSGWRDHRSD